MVLKRTLGATCRAGVEVAGGGSGCVWWDLGKSPLMLHQTADERGGGSERETGGEGGRRHCAERKSQVAGVRRGEDGRDGGKKKWEDWQKKREDKRASCAVAVVAVVVVGGRGCLS